MIKSVFAIKAVTLVLKVFTRVKETIRDKDTGDSVIRVEMRCPIKRGPIVNTVQFMNDLKAMMYEKQNNGADADTMLDVMVILIKMKIKDDSNDDDDDEEEEEEEKEQQKKEED
ncbi:hypothetical protein RRG08_001024 [Elysia crispata]|uniref:Uncharacterized protein n=1 Tax=Elysia crispata TaxID=231223 RepID=A0AAE1AX61_9GAST|nr:hypothetical protein RRG08_001024 [Elysia crispata]